MDTSTIIVIAIIALAALGIVVLPMRKRWNEDGSADEARRQAVARDVVPEAPAVASADLEEPDTGKETTPARGDDARPE